MNWSIYFDDEPNLCAVKIDDEIEDTVLSIDLGSDPMTSYIIPYDPLARCHRMAILSQKLLQLRPIRDLLLRLGHNANITYRSRVARTQTLPPRNARGELEGGYLGSQIKSGSSTTIIRLEG